MKSTDESIDIMTKTLARMEELMKNVSIQLQRLEEIHGSQAKDVFGQSKERKKDIVIDTYKERKKLDDTHISLSEAFEILSRKGYLKPLKPTLLPNPIPRT